MKRTAILLALILATAAQADYLGRFKIDEYVTIPAGSHRFSTGAAYQPTTLTYSIYEEGSTTGIAENTDMTPASPFDGIVGAYQSRVQLTAAAGYEAGKNYTVWLKATTDGVSAVAHHTFQITAEVDQTGDSYAVVSNGTYGNSALKTAIDDIVLPVVSTVGSFSTLGFLAVTGLGLAGTFVYRRLRRR